jgi:probable addiction module antidote protein
MPLKLTKFSVTDHLKTPEQQIAYIEAALDEDDPSFIAVAIGDVAKVRGISQFARDSGLSREVIYKSFRPGGNPTIETVNKALKVLGLKLSLAKAA